MTDVSTGTHGDLQINAYESAYDAAGNWSDITWSAYLYEASSAGSTYSASVSANVSVAGPVATTTPWSGSFGFDWRPAGLQSTLIASGTTRVTHNPDGTGSATVTLYMGSTGTSGAGGPTSVSQSVALTVLNVVPGTPSSITATRVSDTAVTVGWAETSASNGAPTSNTIRQQVNGGAWANLVTISPATSASVADAPNQKTVYGVKGTNSAGDSAWSVDSAAVFTTPAAPTSVAAAKNPSLNIVVTWTDNVAFSEHEHVITHGTVTGGVTTWDGSPLATIAAGTTSYTHTSPSTSYQHVYKIHAHNTDTGSLASADVVSNTVILLTAPNAPTLPTLPAYLDKTLAFVLTWTHNPVDTTAQTAFEVGYSTNGGTTWSTTGKVTSATSSKTFAANTYAANTALTVRVRTWGQCTTGGSDGTGASPWSATQAPTYKTRPVVTISAPPNGGTWVTAALTVALGFSQAESATFVSATIAVYQGATLLETKASTTLSSTLMATRLANSTSYSVQVTVLDSNGLTSSVVTSAFTVAYTLPVPATVTLTYLPNSGVTQVGMVFPTPGGGQVAAVSVNITRTINGATETVTTAYPISGSTLTILDTTPTINGTNTYLVETVAASGAVADVSADLVTTETLWAFLSTGAGYATIVNFCGDLTFTAVPARSSALIVTAERPRPVALFGVPGSLDVSGSATLAPGLGSTPQDMETFILTAGIVCYRDPSGRRMFGQLTGSLASPKNTYSAFQYKVAEAS